LKNFSLTATGVNTTGQSSLLQLPTEPDLVLNGSYIVFSCISGYVNTGGNLNVTCHTSGVWSRLPNCVSNTSSGSPCMVDATTTTDIPNGYLLNLSLSYTSGTTATGN
jgi:hypothetical protein